MSKLPCKPWFDNEDLDQELICRDLEGRADRRQPATDKLDILREWTHRRGNWEPAIKEINDMSVIGNDNEVITTLIDVAEDPKTTGRMKIIELMECLKGKERDVVYLMSKGYKGLEIANKLGLTGGRISQILNNVRDRLGKYEW